MGYQAPRPRNIRPGGGQVIAEGQDAQNMVEGMRESSTGQLNRQAQEIYRRMYRGQEF
jgi:6-phosphogluconolactonase (cycloisomerase 2 family)